MVIGLENVEDVKEEILEGAHTDSKVEEVTSVQPTDTSSKLGLPRCRSTNDVIRSRTVQEDEIETVELSESGRLGENLESEDSPNICYGTWSASGDNPHKPYACGLRDFKCSTATNLKFHRRAHTMYKPYSYSQREKVLSRSECDYKCDLQSHLKKHVMIHMKEKPFACEMCDYRCCRGEQLKLHMRTHTGEKPHSCNYCDYACSQSERMKYHLRTHTGEKPDSCGLCDYTCSRSDHLRAHTRIHTEETSYACSHCDYSSAQASSLKIHVKLMHDDDDDKS